MLYSHIFWALLGMLGYSATTLLVKFAARTGLPSTVVVAIATSIVTATCWLVVVARGQTLILFQSLSTSAGVWSVAAGVAMALAVTSLFRALQLGPANVVVPVYGMFIVGGFVLGVIFLGETLTPAKLVGVPRTVRRQMGELDDNLPEITLEDLKALHPLYPTITGGVNRLAVRFSLYNVFKNVV